MIAPSDYLAALRFDFMTFTERCFRELKPDDLFSHARYLEIIAAKLEACQRGEIRRLIINLPPRHLKSIMASVAFPAFILGHDPTRSIICASYGQDLADPLARDCRTIMQSAWYGNIFPRTRLGRTAVDDFATTRGGGRLATSVGGVLTGRGADFIIIDDPLKPDDAHSQPRRRAANDWIDNTLLSRLNSQQTGVIIVVMQRLHMDDVVGHLVAKGGWEVLCLSAIAEEPERFSVESNLGRVTFSRRKGEALHPERVSLERLGAIRSEIGLYNFSSQYQQNPIPVEGNLIKRKWLCYYDEDSPPEFSSIIQSWDTANKAGELNDYSVCTTWGERDENYYLLDVFRERLEFPDLQRAILRLADRFRPYTVLIEDRASGTQLIQELRRQGLIGLKAGEPSGSDKVMRLAALAPLFEGGHVHLPSEAAWLDDYMTELLGFPSLRHDDQVDSTTQALSFFREGGYSLSIWERLAG